jgi:hypothetical protein
MLLSMSVVDAAARISDDDGVFVEHVRALDDACRRRGITLTFQSDMRLFRDVFLNLNDPRAHLSPLLDASVSDLSEARWILGQDAQGQVVTTQGYRFYPDDGTTSYDRWLSLRMLYDRPEEAPPGESCVLTGEAAAINRKLRSWLASGGTWVHPDHRGPDRDGVYLSELLPRLSRTLGMRQYPQAEATTSGILPKLAKAGIAERYGYKAISPMLVYTRDVQATEMLFLSMPRGEMERDALNFHARLTAVQVFQAAE